MRAVRAAASAAVLAGALLTGCGSDGGTTSRPLVTADECRAATELARSLTQAQAALGAGPQAQLEGLRSAVAALRTAAPALPAVAADLRALADAYATVVQQGGLAAPGAARAVAAVATPTDRVVTYLSGACADAAAVLGRPAGN